MLPYKGVPNINLISIHTQMCEQIFRVNLSSLPLGLETWIQLKNVTWFFFPQSIEVNYLHEANKMLLLYSQKLIAAFCQAGYVRSWENWKRWAVKASDVAWRGLRRMQNNRKKHNLTSLGSFWLFLFIFSVYVFLQPHRFNVALQMPLGGNDVTAIITKH